MSNIPIENKLVGNNGKKSGNTPEQNKAVQGNGGIKKNTPFSMEKVAKLSASFDLNSALDKAYSEAVNYMNNMLDVKDLEISMAVSESTDIGYVTDKITGEQVSSYDGKEMLRLYAHNHQRKGIVVDGKI